MATKDELPKDWTLTKIDSIANLMRGISYKKEQASKTPKLGYIPVLRANNINGVLNFDDLVFVPADLINDEQYIRSGDIIFAMSSGSKNLVGKSAQAQSNYEGSYGAFCALLRPSDDISKDFISYVFQGNDFRRRISEISTGTNINNLKREHILKFEIPLPPLAEQRRIVAKIEELFTQLDAGIASLRTAQAQLKTYRQALLAHAFAGKLSAAWRADNPDKVEPASLLLQRIAEERQSRYADELAAWEADRSAGGKTGRKPRPPKELPPLTDAELADLPALPEGWAWVKLSSIANLAGGVTKGKNLEGKSTVSLPYLRVANVQDGYLDLSEVKLIEVEESDADKYQLVFGDILYTEGGDKDKLGRGTVWKNQISSCIHQNHIFRARLPIDMINPEVIAFYSKTKEAKNYFFRHGKQTTNLASINLTVLSNLPVPIQNSLEQKQILQEIESFTSVLDQLDETITTALQQAESLRQSILKKAFAGQLVPQDADNEPASALLARIRAGKE